MNKNQGIFLALMLLFQGNILASNLEDKVDMLVKGFKILVDKVSVLERKVLTKKIEKKIRPIVVSSKESKKNR